MAPKEHIMARREVVAVCIESPLYFTMPLKKRLDFLKNLERQAYWAKLRDHLTHLLHKLN
jgi:hypothetical protein